MMADPAPTRRDRYLGTLLGLATGDALGAPAEFLSPEQILERWGVLAEMVGGGPHDVEPGETTDATEMTLCVAESLVECRRFDPEDVAQRFLDWFAGGPKDVSLTVRTVLLSLRAGTSLDMAARRAHEILGSPTAGNGSLARCAPMALFLADDLRALHDASLRESGLTHFDRLAGWACAAFNELIVAALGDSLRGSLLQVASRFDEGDKRVSATIREAAVAEPEEIHSSATALDTLRAAVWCTVHAQSFEEAVVLAVNLGNDADTTGAVTGALAGAHFGLPGIPQRWLDRLVERERVTEAASRLADLKGLD
jgi:ADP-ribosyl-[dinitrogen reductase] hydrolase